MFTWNVYYEEADGNDDAKLIGTINALSMGDALQKASEFYEIPSHDLVVKRQDLDK